MSISNSQVNVNSLSPEQAGKLKETIQKLDDSFTRIAGERELIKNLIDDLVQEVPVLEKKVVRKLAKTAHKVSFKMDKEENLAFEELYTSLKLPGWTLI